MTMLTSPNDVAMAGAFALVENIECGVVSPRPRGTLLNWTETQFAQSG